MNRRDHARPAGLTLLELLVVIAMCGALAALLLPLLHTARGNARHVLCVNNLKQIGTGMHVYNLMYQFRPSDSVSVGGAPLGDEQTSHLWSGNLNARRGLGLLANEFIEEPRVFFEMESNWARMVGPAGWTAEDGTLNFENPNASVMSSYVYRQNFGRRPLREAEGQATALVTEYTLLNAGRWNHGGSGAHILFADSRVSWQPAKDVYDLQRFDWFTLAAIDLAGKSGWENALDPLP